MTGRLIVDARRRWWNISGGRAIDVQARISCGECRTLRRCSSSRRSSSAPSRRDLAYRWLQLPIETRNHLSAATVPSLPTMPWQDDGR